jgi:hypothetical protein
VATSTTLTRAAADDGHLTVAGQQRIVQLVKRLIALSVAVLTIAAIRSQDASACGDKFLLVGRGARFQRAYAAVHPASILIVLPVKSVKVAAVRDSSLATALKMAGHRVESVQQPANLGAILGRSRHDIVLAERADAPAIRIEAERVVQQKPSVIAVLEDASPADVAVAQQQLDYVLNTPQRLVQILNLLDDVMKARLEASPRVAASGF